MFGIMEINDATAIFGALAQPTRLNIVRLLIRREPEGAAAGDIARALEVPNATLSAHLKVLTQAGLVAPRRESRSIIYRAELSAIEALIGFLLRDCCAGDPSICGPLMASLSETAPECASSDTPSCNSASSNPSSSKPTPTET
ncbi:ArsR/SmtB family transcription factor [Larsenimonas suaedae]|uniref:Metalloregulator ArsR/SmtB family transcription factor n=1 Tax=Larsenimonas suaedae TaxID=1851019 RepID=A0ABU1GSM1_9GAMM|nr:metalloregulator ArsR/SmtB family transcription factor [Larsenimonas suaedae]MCM2972188.1 metalloregulator ArsR/SmtB family transcription factor [Larsenimonas suaedae]MDR5895016.1 metalloregulator ArsR/SmtB family transcription factor [Larsenimonas suaedae]